MKVYAEIYRNRVRAISAHPADLVHPGDTYLTYVEITALNPRPQEGDYYDGNTFVFVNNYPATIDKTEMLADGVDVVTVTGFDDITEVEVINVGVYEVSDGEFGFTIDMPGQYVIRCKTYPYNPKEFIVNAS